MEADFLANLRLIGGWIEVEGGAITACIPKTNPTGADGSKGARLNLAISPWAYPYGILLHPENSVLTKGSWC